MSKVYLTPGVYIEEKSAFPNSVAAVPTAVPAFVGHTAKASSGDRDLTDKAVKITSWSEFEQFFGGAPKTVFDVIKSETGEGFEVKAVAQNYSLYYSIKFFYSNGGGDCYILSVGNYENEISKERLSKLDPLKKESDITMLVIPEAVLLAEKDCQEVQQLMLAHCGGEMKNRIAILDVYNGHQARITESEDIINKFREGIGDEHLDFGAAYYPWLETTIVRKKEVSFENINSASIESLISMLKKEVDQLANGDATKAENLKKKIDELNAPTDKLHQELLVISPLYKSILEELARKMNLLPPSSAMAGIYTMVDNNVGVFQPPANVSVGSVVKPAVNISNDEQDDLNVPLNGKAVNAIRSFPGKGVLVWGARTLDGNSMDWRYISVKRTVIMIEQSVKNAVEAYVFEPNVSSTWENVKAMLNNFLTNVWAQGALAGAAPEDAFSVEVGLGTTMTPADIFEGTMRITIKLAVTRPAEFIVLTFEQDMQRS